MNRHHPYGGGGYDGPPNRRGGPPGGFGPDRGHRFSDRGGSSRGRGGFRGGRGGGGGGGGGGGPYGGYDNGLPAYDQGPPQGDIGGYNGYESGPPQDPYYSSFEGGMQGQYGPPPDSGADFDEGYGYHEDGSGPNFGGYGRNQRRGGAPRGRDREDKLPESVIEERIQREKPCRTLFIRNVKYETDSEDVRRMFEEHGEIKTFFDLIANRGMVFVTYYDIRAAERARERLQGSEISGRPIDVHYSLPRDDHGSRGGEKDKNQQMQGNLLVTLRSLSGQPVDDNEVRRKFQQFGDIRSVRPVGDRPDQRYVEYFDTRACAEAHDRLRHQGLQDGTMDIMFASELDNPRAQSPRRGDRGDSIRGSGRDWEDFGGRPHGRRGRRDGRGRGRGSGDDWERREWGGRERERSRPFEDEFGRMNRAGFNDRGYGGRGGGPGGSGPGPGPSPIVSAGPGGHGPVGPPGYAGGLPPPPPPPTYTQPPAAVPPPSDRLEQAKKVQELLAALKPGGAPAAQPPPSAQMPSGPPVQPPNPYYGAPPIPPYPGPPPAPGAYPPPGMQLPVRAQPPPAAPTPAPSSQVTNSANGAPALANLPPNILALLQQTSQPQSQQRTPPPPGSYGMPPPLQGMPLSGMGMPPLPPPGQYQALMSYLQQQKR